MSNTFRHGSLETGDHHALTLYHGNVIAPEMGTRNCTLARCSWMFTESSTYVWPIPTCATRQTLKEHASGSETCLLYFEGTLLFGISHPKHGHRIEILLYRFRVWVGRAPLERTSLKQCTGTSVDRREGTSVSSGRITYRTEVLLLEHFAMAVYENILHSRIA